jgi:DNA mismatch endonuclease (patch repair protein)
VADFLTKLGRSELMSRVRSKGNFSTELRLVALFREEGIAGWRRGYPLFGKPDFVFPKLRLAIFVDGCFWHGCPTHGKCPRSNRAFWRAKLERNIARDRLVTRTLRARGWRVLRIWHHALKRQHQGRTLARIREALATERVGFASPMHKSLRTSV